MEEVFWGIAIIVIVIVIYLTEKNRRFEIRVWKSGQSIKTAKQFLEENTECGKKYNKKAYFDGDNHVVISSPKEVYFFNLNSGRMERIDKLIK